MESEPSTVGALGSSVSPVLGGDAFASALRGGGTGGAASGGRGACDRAEFADPVTSTLASTRTTVAASASTLTPSALRAGTAGTPDRRGGAGARELGEGGGGGGGKRCMSRTVGST